MESKVFEIFDQSELNKSDIIHLLSLNNVNQINSLYKKADQIRKQFCGDEVHLRGIIEFSNFCERDCLYCGLRISNDSLPRYRMTKEEILKTCDYIVKAKIKTIVLQSGEDSLITKDFITDIIKSIKKKYDVAITLSLGERNFDDYDSWLKAGADRYLLKHETANEKLYFALHKKQKLNERIKHIEYLKKIGFQVGTGNIIGLPGQTIADIADDILLCKELISDMASFSPFIPSNNTPLSKISKANVELTLKTMAVARIVLKDAHIPSTTALGSLVENGREKGLQVGANVVMPNYTPNPYRQHYKIYEGKICINDNPLAYTDCLQLKIESLGRKVSDSKGHSLKK